MRPVHLVPAEAVHVDPPGVHVDGAVRRVRHGVDAQQRSGNFVDGLREGLHVVDGAEDVAGVRAGDQAGPRRQELAERGAVELRVGLRLVGHCGAPPFQRALLPRGKLHPRGDVGFVVEQRDDDLRLRRDVVEQCGGEVAEQLGRGGPEDDFFRRGVDVFRHSVTASFKELGRCLRDRVAGAELDVAGGQVIRDTVYDFLKDL
nr:hypothetical protein CFP56_70210 [Quercus suber]